jgi:hypothetical protein
MGKHQVQDVLDAISLCQKLAKLRVPARQLAHRSGESVAVSVVNPNVEIGHGLEKVPAVLLPAVASAKAHHCMRSFNRALARRGDLML